jgi:hypothetical protein
MNSIVTSGSLPTALIDSVSRAHYYPDTTVGLSIQGFTPISTIPGTVIVRVRRGQPTGTGIACRVFDSSGTQILVDNPSVSIDSVADFTNILFPIHGDTGQFPAFGLWTVEIDVSHADLVGVALSYNPTYPMTLGGGSTPGACTTTVVIS